MALSNSTFELGSSVPGEAPPWTLIVSSTTPAYAAFGASKSFESFSSWGEMWLKLSDVVVVVAQFSGVDSVEGFFSNWFDGSYSMQYEDVTWGNAMFNASTTPSSRENFSVGQYFYTWDSIVAVGGLVDVSLTSWFGDWSQVASAPYSLAGAVNCENFGWT